MCRMLSACTGVVESNGSDSMPVCVRTGTKERSKLRPIMFRIGNSIEENFSTGKNFQV